jgi:2-oxoglutarate dehydrogenase E1 component
MKLTEALSADFIDQQYRLWKADPEKLSADWRFYFEGFELALKAAPKSLPVSETVTDDDQSIRQARVEAMKYRYRDLGHLLACLDPLMACPTDHPLLNLDAFDLSPEDLDREFFTRRFSNNGPKTSLREIQKALRETYCHSIGIEFMHLQDPEERNWLRDHMEPVRNQPQLDAAAKRRILELLYKSGLFESFLHKKYIGQTRFSLEGAEAIIPMLDTVLNRAGDHGCREIILGTAHRGRLNVQANILQKPYEELFREFESCYNPEDTVGAGDVKYHNGYLADLKTAHQHPMRVFLVNNPSHLESVNPVVEGLARARMDMMGGSFQQMMPILFHGDAAFAGQGIVMETLNMSQLEGYRTGGTLHVIINNQIGYTTLPEDARSTRYSTDVAKMLMVPIFHVHGENPEALVHVALLPPIRSQ